MDLMTDAAHIRELTRVDWVVSSTWNRLHHVELTDVQCVELEDGGYLEGPILLACGRTAKTINIPGLFTRIGADRCTGCCRVTGLPAGVGSPKNSPECRALLGMPPT